MKLNKDEREVKIAISSTDLEGPLEGLEDRIRQRLRGLECNDPVLEEFGWDTSDWELKGWRPATEKEMERSRKASAKAKEAAARKKEKAKALERAEYERLRKKFANIDQIDEIRR